MTEIRTDIVDVYIFRRTGLGGGGTGGVQFLQLLRAGKRLGGTWHPLMGHAEAGEHAQACAVRELAEEVGLKPGDAAWLGFWQLEQVHPYFIASLDAVVLSPRFCVEVDAAWTPRLNDEHTDSRWVDDPGAFMWPGQRAACAEVLRLASEPGSAYERALRLDPGG